MADKLGYRRQVMIPDEIWDKINILAKADITSASSIVRTACQNYIAKRAKEARAAKKKRAAGG